MNADLQDRELARRLRESVERDPELIHDPDSLRAQLAERNVASDDSSRIAIVESVARCGIAAQMHRAPADLPVELAAPTWLADLRKLHSDTDVDLLRDALATWAFALRCDVRAALLRLIREDRTLAFDAERCRAALLEACPERALQINLLARAIDGGITVELEKLPADTAQAALLSDLESRLHCEHFRDGLARWTLDAWREALGTEIDPVSPEEPSELPWSLTTEVLASMAAGVFLMKQLFWYLWGIDSENRFWFGMESTTWTIGAAVVIGSVIGYFGGLIYSTAGRFDFPTRRTSKAAVFRGGCLSTVCAAAVAGLLVLVERILPAQCNLPVAALIGIVTSLVALRYLGKGTCLVLALATIVAWAIYWLHWLIYWDYDPEAFCLVSNAPGVDAFFVFLVAAAGAGPLVRTGWRDWSAWKSLPENRFRSWPELVHAAGFRLSPTGDITVTVDSGGTVSVSGVADGKERVSFAAHDTAITDVDISPDGRLIATAAHNMTVCVNSAEDGHQRVRLTGHWQSATSVAWSPDGELIASGGNDGTIRVRESDTWRPLTTISTRHGAISKLAFAHLDGASSRRLVVGYTDGALECFGISPDGRQHESIWKQMLTHGVTELTALSDGLVAVATSRSRVAVFTSTGRELASRDVADTDSSGVAGIAAIPGHDGTLLVSTNESLLAWQFASDEVNQLASPGAETISCCRCPADLSRFNSSAERVQSTSDCVLVATHGGNQWFLLQRSGKAEPAETSGKLEPRTSAAGQWKLTPLTQPDASTDEFKPVDGRLQERLERMAERHPRGVMGIAALLLVVGVTALLRLLGSFVAAAGLISVQWLKWGSFRPMLKPHGDFTNELRQEWFEMLDHGGHIGTLIGFTTAAFIGLRLFFGDRWVLAVILQDAQRGTLAAAKWLIPSLAVVALPLIVLKSTDWFQCLRSVIWTGGLSALFLLLIGWVCGGCCGALRSVALRMRAGRDTFNRLCGPSRGQVPEAGVDGLLGLTAIASAMGIILIVGGIVLMPAMEFAMVNIFRMDSGGTASGLGQLTVIDDGAPDAIPIETVWQAFRDDHEAAAAEYVGYEFVFTGTLQNRAPHFTLSSASGESEEQLALCMLTPKHEIWATLNDYTEELYPGRRVMVVGLCEGTDEFGIVRFSNGALLNWTFDEREQPATTAPTAPSPESAGDAHARE